MAWVYSTSSFNGPTSTLFVLLGFLFFRKFKNTGYSKNLIFSGLSLGFGFLVRNDVIFIIIILLIFLIINLVKNKLSLKNIVAFVLPLIVFATIFGMVNIARFGSFLDMGGGSGSLFVSYEGSLIHGAFGLLFSPGAGIFIFSPILLTVFISFIDFKKNKQDIMIFLALLFSFIIFYGGLVPWHGFVSWGTRYLIPVIPFLLLPLGASIEKRKGKIFKISIFSLAALGTFFNFAGFIQDVMWFVWGRAGGSTGLYSLATGGKYAISIHPAVIWTFEYSQLTQAIIMAFTKLQMDLFLFKILGPVVSLSVLGIILISSIILLFKQLKKSESQIISNN
jgi:hypothetical protein